MRPPLRDEPTLNLELQEWFDQCRHGSLQPTDLEADIALFEEWLEPRPTRRCPQDEREWLRQPYVRDFSS